MSSLCCCSLDLMVYLHPAAAHESYTTLRTHLPASAAHDGLCLACRVTKAMKINQLLFRTVDPESVEVSSRRLLKYGDGAVDSLQAGPKRYTKLLMGAALKVKAKSSAPLLSVSAPKSSIRRIKRCTRRQKPNKQGTNPIILLKNPFLFHFAWIKSPSCFCFYASLLHR